MTYRLKLLGSVRLEGTSGVVRGRAAHRRRLGLLALLAVPVGRTQTRERIIDCLWPEASSEGGRRLLTESLYVIRQVGELVLSAGGDLRLNPDVVTSDAGDFEAAVERADFRAAVKLYEGPLLDGWYVEDAPDFERWAESERARLAALHTRAVEGIALQEEEAGAWAAAVEWRRMLWTRDPYSSRLTLGLMRSLAEGGDPAAAYRVGETHVALIREERGVQPHGDVSQLLDRLRTEGMAPSPRVQVTPPSEARAAEGDGAAPVPSGGASAEEVPQEEGRFATGAADVPAGSTAPRRAPGDTGARGGAPPPGPWSRPLWRRAGTVGVLLLAAILTLLISRAPARRADPDLASIAVLYFEDLSPGGDYAHIASGVSESLIHRLGQVPGLRVISANGVRPYRHTTLPLDSIAERLDVGTIVGGSIRRGGGRVRVTVELVDARTGRQIESRSIERPDTALLALEEGVAEEVVAFLRVTLGSQVRLNARRDGTQSAVAYELALRGEAIRRDAVEARVGRHPADVASSLSLLERADSLLREAERADGRWLQPILERGWIALDQAEVVEGRERLAALAAARAHAERALRRQPRDARAREIRGTAFWRQVAGASDSAKNAPELRRAEADLRGAVAEDPSLASAWITLGQLLLFTGYVGEAGVAMNHAVDADTYLTSAADALDMIFVAALLRSEFAVAASACARGSRAFPHDWRFVQCRLTLMREDPDAPADPDVAWALVERLDRIDPPDKARAAGNAYGPLYRRVVAASISAEAGDTRRARAELARARREVAENPEMRVDLAYDEAHLRFVLGEHAAADSLLRYYVTEKPALAPFIVRDALFAPLLDRQHELAEWLEDRIPADSRPGGEHVQGLP